MIKHWEIVENKWTQDSAYVLCIVGDETDSALVTKELSSFCKLVDVKVSSFNYIFELLNVTDDDILQKIRNRIEEIVAKSSSKDKSDSLSLGPVRISEGGLAFSPEDIAGDNLIMKSSDKGDSFSSSSDGLQISIDQAQSSKLEDTKTNNIDMALNIQQEEKQKIEEPKPVVNKTPFAKKEEKSAPAIKKEEKKEEKVSFFKRLFSFGKKKNEPKKQEKILEPLPIETKATKVTDIATHKEVLKSENREDKNNSMHGVVVKGTAFPTAEMGIQKIKEVSLEGKPLFDKEQNNDNASLESQVPLDDIFAEETI